MIIPERTNVPMPTHIDTRRLWTGGSATAVVAGFTVVTGVLVARSIFHVVVPASRGLFATAIYAGRAGACALLATALLHVLLISAPRPLAFFAWITVLADVAAASVPFTRSAPLGGQVLTALINIMVGIAVVSLLPGVARTATGPARPCVRG